MATNPINPPLTADLPENWTEGQTVGPNGTDVGLTQQHGYNYLMKKVNAASKAVNMLGETFENVPTLGDDGKIPKANLPVGVANGVAGLDSTGKVPESQLPDMDYETAGTAARLINRTTGVNTADSNYTTFMARGESLNAAELTPEINGTIAWQYE